MFQRPSIGTSQDAAVAASCPETRRAIGLASWLRISLVLAGISLAALVLSVPVALGYFGSPGSGYATAALGTLTAPAAPTATPGAGTVALSWSSVAPPTGSGTVSYYVQRDGASADGNCPTQASPSTGTSCTDSGLSPGTYNYTVTAVWRSWSATSSSTPATVTGPLDHFSLAAATTAPTAGAGDNLTIMAQDTAGNTVTSYGGDRTLTFGGASTIGANQPTVTSKTGAAVAFGTAETITFTNGVATVSGSEQRRDDAVQGGDRKRERQRRDAHGAALGHCQRGRGRQHHGDQWRRPVRDGRHRIHQPARCDGQRQLRQYQVRRLRDLRRALERSELELRFRRQLHQQPADLPVRGDHQRRRSRHLLDLHCQRQPGHLQHQRHRERGIEPVAQLQRDQHRPAPRQLARHGLDERLHDLDGLRHRHGHRFGGLRRRRASR